MSADDEPSTDDAGRDSAPTSEAELLEFLADAGLPPPIEMDEETRQRTNAAASAALARITADPTPDTPSRSQQHGTAAQGRGETAARGRDSRRLLGRRWIFLALPIASAIAVAALLITSPNRPPMDDRDSGGPLTAEATGPTPPVGQYTLVSNTARALNGITATPYLTRLAAVAEQQAPQNTGPVQYTRLAGWYFDQSASTLDLVPTITERYFSPDGQIESRELAGAPLDAHGLLSAADDSTLTSDETFQGPEQGPGFAQQLPTEARALERRLVPDPRECPDVTECLVNQLTQLQQTWVVPPTVTAAGWRVLAAQDGVDYLGASDDRLGRPAWAFATPTTDAGRLTILYISPSTGAFLGSEEILQRAPAADRTFDDLEFPAVIGFTTLVKSERLRQSDVPG